MEIYELIRMFREKQGISQSHIAEHMGISTNKISKIELGKTALTVDFLEKYCSICSIDVVKLFEIKRYQDLNLDEKIAGYYMTESM